MTNSSAPGAPNTSVAPPIISVAPTQECLVSWAVQELGLDGPADRRRLRSVVIDRLESDGWLPSPTVQRAFEVLAQPADGRRQAPLGSQDGMFYVLAEAQVRAEVERFVVEFFDLPPLERRSRWNGLVEECRAHPRLSYRLKGLEPGLEVQLPEPSADPAVRDLSRHLGELFVSSPAHRARKRLTPSPQFASTAAEWSAAARKLKQQYPLVAGLDVQCMNDLSFGIMTPPPTSVSPPAHVPIARDEPHVSRNLQRSVPRRQRLGARRSRRSYLGTALVGGGTLVVILVFVIRAAWRFLVEDPPPHQRSVPVEPHPAPPAAPTSPLPANFNVFPPDRR